MINSNLPQQSTKQLVSNILLILVSAFILFIGLTQNINIYDEGLAIVGSERVMDGELPYKDFWTIYSPGQFYLLAGAFEIFGSTILVERVLTIIIYIGLAWVWLSIAAKINPRQSRFISLIVLAAWIAMTPLFGRSIPTALLFCYLSGFFLFRHFESRTVRDTLLAGFFLGMAALFRHDIAGFLFGAIFQAIFFFSLSDQKAKNLNFFPKILYGLKKASGVVVGLLPFIIPFFLLIGSVGFELLWHNLIFIPMEVFGEFRALPFPNPIESLAATRYPLIKFWESILFYVPLTIFVITIVGIIVRTKKKIIALNGPRFWIEITAFNFGINLLNTAMVRSDIEHTIPAWTGALLCLLVVLNWIKNNYTRGVVSALVFLFIGGYPTLKLAKHILDFDKGKKAIISDISAFPASADVKWSKDYSRMIDLINDKLEPGDYLYSGVVNHTNFLINDVMIYNLTETRPAVYYHELHPGVSTTFMAQNRIFTSLEKLKPKMVVLADFGKSREANRSSKIKVPDVVTPYIKAHYTKISRFGEYILYVRDDSAGLLPL